MGTFNSANGLYLEYVLDKDEQIDGLCLGMLTNNNIPGVAGVSFIQINEDRIIKFDVKGKITLSEYISNAASNMRINTVFRGIANAVKEADKYMIGESSFVFDESRIFINSATLETVMICLPLVAANNPAGMKSLFERIVTNINVIAYCDNAVISRIANYIKSASTIDVDGLLLFLDGSESSAPRSTGYANPGRSREIGGATKTTSAPKKTENVPEKPIVRKGKVQDNHGEEKPGKTDVPHAPEKEQHEDEAPVKKMSLFYLASHYSRENAQLYKELKNKAEKLKEDQKGAKKEKSKTRGKASDEFDFNVPGQNEDIRAAVNSVIEKKVPKTFENNKPVEKKENDSQPVVIKSHALSEHYKGDDFGATMDISAKREKEAENEKPGEEVRYQIMAYLINNEKSEKIIIDKTPFLIGRQPKPVDYSLDSKMVSREHCEINIINGLYFVTDLDSKNFTYIDENKLRANQPTEIFDGQILKVADTELIFHRD